MCQIDIKIFNNLSKRANQFQLGIGGNLNEIHFLLAISEESGNLNKLLKSFGINSKKIISQFQNINPAIPINTNLLLEYSKQICILSKKEVILPSHILIALLSIGGQENLTNRILRLLGTDTLILKQNLMDFEGIKSQKLKIPPRQSGRRINHLKTNTLKLEPLKEIIFKKDSILKSISTDLTFLASQGKIDSIIGRSKEIKRIIRILSRKKKNNPVLIGEAGVGKTAIVEGLAIKLSNNDVPKNLSGKRILSINLTSLVAGTVYRGQFEEKMRKFLEEVQLYDNLIIFFDEIHLIMGSGSTSGNTMDIANILKPVLTGEKISLIGATTIEEFKEIEKDKAITRRLIPVIVNPPTEKETLRILKAISKDYEEYHKISYSADSLNAAINLSQRFLPQRNLPDKAIDLLDEAGARKSIQDKKEVTEEDISQIITEWTKIPVLTLKAERDRLRNLGEKLRREIFGQDSAISSIVSKIQSIRDPSKPIGSFIFLGPTGVGKTYLAKRLAFNLFGAEDALIRIDMSEYSQAHEVSKLIGAPPGYVGYGEEGILTGQVRKKPFSIILLDEIEKAHPDIYKILLQIFDEGRITDSQGRKINFRNTIIIMTSNIKIGKSNSPGFGKENQSINDSITNSLIKNGFSLELINRIDKKVVFNKILQENISKILERELSLKEKQLSEQGIKIEYSLECKKLLIKQGFSEMFGARKLKRTIESLIMEPLGKGLIDGSISSGDKFLTKVENKKIIFEKLN